MTLNNRQALLLGKAVGDALGAVVETAKPEDAAAYVKAYLRHLACPKDGVFTRPFGQYTDDTQMARELLLSVAENGGTFDPKYTAKHWAAFITSGRLTGGGRTTEDAAKALQNGTPWDKAGNPRPSNGSAMRAAVTALLNTKQDELKHIATVQSQITHTAPEALSASVMMALGAWQCLHHSKLDKTHFLETLAKATAEITPHSPELLERLDGLMRQSPSTVMESLYYKLDLAPEWRKYPGISVHATEATLWALYAFLKYPDDYMAAVSTAISGGGDTDTTAAMAGALSGAYLGLDAIPSIYTDIIHDNGDWQADKLAQLVADLS